MIIQNHAQQQKTEHLRAKLEEIAIKVKQRQADQQALKTILLNSGSTSHFNKVSEDLPTIEPSNEQVQMASGQVCHTTSKTELPL